MIEGLLLVLALGRPPLVDPGADWEGDRGRVSEICPRVYRGGGGGGMSRTLSHLNDRESDNEVNLARLRDRH